MRHLILLKYAWLIIGLIVASPNIAAPSVQRHYIGQLDTAISLPPLASNISIVNGVEYQFETKPMNFEEVANSPASNWTRYPNQVVNFKTSNMPVWLRFDVNNSIENSSEWILKIRFPHLDHIEVIVYHPEDRRWDAPLISGLAVPMQLRPIAHRNFLFPLSLEPGKKSTIYIRAMSKTKLILPMIMWKRDLFAQSDSHHIMILGLYFGIMGVMLVYNISLFAFIRDRSYFFYSLYIFTVLLYTLMSTGVGALYIWDGSYWLKAHSYGIFSSFSFLAGSLFIRNFLSLKSYGGWVYHSNTIINIAWFSFGVMFLFSLDPLLIQLEDLLGLIATSIGLVTGIYLWNKGNVSARYFTIGWAVLILGTYLLLFGLMGIVEFNTIISYSQMTGFIVELVLLSFALADRVNRERKAREEAQQMALRVTRRISRELEKRVHERTVDLKKAMLRLKKVNQELSQLNITDPLTKVYNRRHFNEVLVNEVKRANRTRQPVAVIMVDIDHFKSINDTHGHPVGDKCLYLVARALKQQMARSVDMVARYGGEEFVLVLTATPKEKAVLLAEKVRRAVEKLAVINKGIPIKLRVSLGVAAWIPENGESYEKLIKAADEALYKAKRNGRNQVIASAMA